MHENKMGGKTMNVFGFYLGEVTRICHQYLALISVKNSRIYKA